MAIVRLGDLCEIIPGKKPNKDLHKYITKNKNDGFNWIKQRDLENFNVLLKTSSYFKKEFISMTRYTSGKNIYFFPDCDIKAFESKIDFCYDGHTWELINNEKILKKFLLYSINKNIDNLKKQQVGTTLKFITRPIFENFKIYIPNINDQQKIIDIIEPFENKLNELTNKLNIIKNIEDRLLNYSNSIGYMIDNDINIEKGKNIESNMLTNNITNLPFVNISHINNKINKYVTSDSISANVNLGDVLLSLDGTPGLVNNFVYGFNGYGYKLCSKIIDNYVIYYSLLHKYNKNLIQSNSKGSVILHASSAKNKLLLFSFKYVSELKTIYEYSFELKKQIKFIKNFINLLIKFLIPN